MLDVDEMIVVGWELIHWYPHPMHIRRIIDFLGYVPENLFPATTSVGKSEGTDCFTTWLQNSLQGN